MRSVFCLLAAHLLSLFLLVQLPLESDFVPVLVLLTLSRWSSIFSHTVHRTTYQLYK